MNNWQMSTGAVNTILSNLQILHLRQSSEDGVGLSLQCFRLSCFPFSRFTKFFHDSFELPYMLFQSVILFAKPLGLS